MGKIKSDWYSFGARRKAHYFRPILLNTDYMVSLCGYVCSKRVVKKQAENKCKKCLNKYEVVS
jgi:hypothetical protein